MGVRERYWQIYEWLAKNLVPAAVIKIGRRAVVDCRIGPVRGTFQDSMGER